MFYLVFALVRLMAFAVYAMVKLMIWLMAATIALVAAGCAAISTGAQNRRANRGVQRFR